MRPEHCFVRVAEGLNTQPLLDRLAAQPALWRAITARQEYPGTAHKDTETVFIRGPRPNSHDLFNDIETVDYPKFVEALSPEAMNLVGLCMAQIATGYAEPGESCAVTEKRVGAMGRVMIVNLHRDGYITPHLDEGEYADHYDRFHLALYARPGNRFNVADQHFEARQGELWWFNHKLTHSVVNYSDDDRVHLILDIVAPDFRMLRNRALSVARAHGGS